MRHLTVAIVGLIVVALCGCEAAAPPQAAERLDSAPAPPAPAAPAEPAVAKAPPPTVVEKGTAEIEKRAAAVQAARAAAEAAQGTPATAPPANTPPAAAPDAGAAPPDAAAPPGDELSKAEVGVGVKGKDYGGPGFVTTPIETMFTVEERIAFDVQIPNSMKIYKAAHNNKGPKTNEEFMDVIIKENGVQLPELPPGSAYWYDAKTEQLMVRTPKPDAGT